ncbi:MAG TPA: outer membrane beta-barrel protein [Acidisarcina sp.]|nr:outer membrane beta-barrel protein [Acidisarcina sp.]
MLALKKKLLLLAPFLVIPIALNAQAVPAARGGTGSIFAGGTYSAFKPDFGSNWLMGIGGFFDVNLTDRYGAEGEARLLRFNQRQDVHEDTYMIGPKINFRHNRFDPYGKVLFGVGEINLTNSYAHGGFFAMAFGGGLDYRLTPRLKVRVVDYEYQMWPGFLNKGLSPSGFSFGASYRVFK